MKTLLNDDDVPISVFILTPTIVLLALLGGNNYGGTHTATGESEGIAQDNAQDEHSDLRAEAIVRYLRDYDAIQPDIGSDVVSIGDDYGINPYLLIAIYVRESSAGKRCFNGYNCFGFGNYFYNNVLDGFSAVAQALSGNGKDGHYYKDKTTEERLRKYNSANPEYANDIFWLMSEIEKYE